MTRIRTLAPRLKALDGRTVKVQPKKAEPCYGWPEWKDLVARLIQSRGRRCQECGRTGCRIFADHVVELRDGGAPLDPANLELVCGACHTRRTVRRRAERMRR